MNFDEMSDFDVNKKLAALIGEVLCDAQPASMRIKLSECLVKTSNRTRSVDYCNSWADMGPLIVEYDICLNHANSCTKEAFIRDKFGFVCFTGEHRVNVLRAAAICLIKKLELEGD